MIDNGKWVFMYLCFIHLYKTFLNYFILQQVLWKSEAQQSNNLQHGLIFFWNLNVYP